MKVLRRGFIRRQEEGVALVVSIALIGIVGLLMAAVVAVAVAETRQTGRDRQRSQAVMAAEARVDELIAQMQARPLADLPCGDSTSEVAILADRLDVAATVTYFDASGNDIVCADLATTEATEALVSANAVSDSIAQQTPASRSIEALLRLTPVYGNELDKAIFGNAGIRFANHARVYGLNGEPNADIYTNGNFRCDNNQHFYGSISAYGSVTMANSCIVEGDVHALTEYRADNPQVRVNGNVLVSSGNIILNQSQLGQQARASGSVTGNVCTGPQGAEKCFSGVSVPPPTRIDFPILNWDGATQAEWAANGFTTVNIPGTYGGTEFKCGWWNGRKLIGSDGKQYQLNGKVDGAAAWMFENSWRLSGPTVLRSTCSQAVSFQGTGIQLNDHLAVISDAGITFSNNSPITATSADERNLYLIQPYDARPQPCTVDGISLDNQVSVAPNVNVLMYSPCNIRKANNTDHYGQIYAGGQANIDNSLTMYYKPVPVWGTLTTSSSIEAYHLEMLFKRENA